MQALTDLIANAKAALNTEFDPMNVFDLEAVDLKAFDKEGIVDLLYSMLKFDRFGYEVYIGEGATKEQLRDAIVSVKFEKVSRGGRKYSGGPQYNVVIDHRKLTRADNQAVEQHNVILTPRKYRGQPKHWIQTNIFDGRKVN